MTTENTLEQLANALRALLADHESHCPDCELAQQARAALATLDK